MNAALPVVVVLATFVATSSFAGENERSRNDTSSPDSPDWEFALSGYPDGRSRRR